MFLFAAEGDHFRKAQLVKMQKQNDYKGSRPKRNISNTIHAPTAQRHLKRGDKKIVKARGDG